MRITQRAIASFAVFLVIFIATPSRSNAQDLSSLSGLLSLVAAFAPPALPEFSQPLVAQSNMIWQPGYWAYGPGGYFWVPGTWVQAPQTGLLWTPGYWAYNGGQYQWNPGYWAQSVGYYGGVNYGNGYYGSGYDGGRWSGNTFQYNTYVTHVNTTVVRYVYVDRSVQVRPWRHAPDYHGGPGGIVGRPTQMQIAVAHEHHFAMTDLQQQHIRVAAENRNYLARVNNGRPPQISVAAPLTAANHPRGFTPLRTSDRASAAATKQGARAPVHFQARETQPVVHPAQQVRQAQQQVRPVYRQLQPVHPPQEQVRQPQQARPTYRQLEPVHPPQAQVRQPQQARQPRPMHQPQAQVHQGAASKGTPQKPHASPHPM